MIVAYSVSRSDSLHILPIELVGAIDCGLVPVGPVDVVLEGGDGEGMTEHVSGVEDHTASGPVVAARRYRVHFCINLDLKRLT